MSDKDLLVPDPALRARMELIGRYVCEADDPLGEMGVEFNFENVSNYAAYMVTGRMLARIAATMCYQMQDEPDATYGPNEILDHILNKVTEFARRDLHREVVSFSTAITPSNFKTV